MSGNGEISPEMEVLPLWRAVFCLDCEAISNTTHDECPSCKGRSVVSLSRMIGGSLIKEQPRSLEIVLFDITITVGMRQMHAEDLNRVLELLSSLIGRKLERAPASVHIDVAPSAPTIPAGKTLQASESDRAA